MFAYWALFSIFASGALTSSRRIFKATSISPIFVVAMAAMVLMVGLRYQVGGDWYAYEQIFVDAGYTKFERIFTLGDPGYLLLNWAVFNLGFQVWLVNLVCASIVTWGLMRLARQQPNPWLVVVVAIPYFVIVVAMGYSRQAVAIGLLMGGIAAFERGATIRFLVYAILAATFHKSAVIIVPLVILAAARNRFAIYATGAALGAVLFFTFLDQFLDLLLVNYLESEMSSEGTEIRVAMNVIPATLFLLFQKRFSSSEQDRRIWRNFAIVSLLSVGGLVFMPSSTIVDRLSLYLIPIQLLVLARLPHAFRKAERPDIFLVIFVIVYSAAIQFTWLTYADHARYWLPYQTYLSPY